jgi:hypothetical protein
MAASNRNKGLLLCLGAACVLALIVLYERLSTSAETVGRSQFGTVAIPMPNGVVIYGRRESRGLNYDVLSLSPNPNPCATANPETDYIFRYDGSPLYLGHGQNDLTVYRYGSVEVPKSQLPSATINLKHLTFDEFQSVRESYQKKNIEKLDVPLNMSAGGCQ